VHLDKLVAIIDDEKDITTLFRDALDSVSGIIVFSFTDSVSALEHFSHNKDDYALVMSDYVLVMSDYRMPGLNGLELLKKVKKNNPNVRTILISAFNFGQDPTFQQCMKEGVIDTSIEKPITINRLRQSVLRELSSQVDKKWV